MRILISSLIIIFLTAFSLAIEISPEKPQIFNGYPIKSMAISTNPQTTVNFAEYMPYMQQDNEFYLSYMVDDIGSLMNSGYVQDINVNISANEESAVDITFNIKLNPMVRYIELSNMTILNQNIIKSKLYNKLNTPLNYAYISSDIQIIESAYHDQGYVLAKVTNVFFIKSVNSLIFNVDEGLVDNIVLSGAGQLNPMIILRELNMQPGKVFNINLVNEDKDIIFRSGYFSQVSMPKVAPSYVNPGKVDILYEVQQRKINNLQLGLEQLQNSKLSLALSLKLPNFRNSGEGLYFKGQGIIESYFKEYSYYVKYSDPWFTGRKLPLNLMVWHQINDEIVNNLATVRVQRIGGEANLEPYFFKQVKTIVGYRNEAVSDVAGVYSPYQKNSLKLTLLSDTTNDYNNPLSGSKTTIEMEKGNNLFNLINFGGIDFSRYTFEHSVYYNLYKKDVLAIRFSTGFMQFNTQSQIFEQDKFLIGGAYSLRGYPESYANLANAIIGNKKILLNVEYRVFLTEWLQGAIFIDGGIATDNDLQLDKLKWGKGVGIRILTPLAPLRFDFAIGDNNQFLLHFGLGQLF
ncbi:MAG: BamA/TamA family outer membrane protein [Candidatus Margulisbacteria bacterium]|nr:BamA/TamA family outer membrane protein [Candidatus Margulisiibacteriota bacterium]